jgi:hypothetical protein
LLGLLLHPDGPADDSVDVAVWSGFMAAAAAVVIVVVGAARRRPGLPAPATPGTAEEITTAMSTNTATAIVAAVPAERRLSTLAIYIWYCLLPGSDRDYYCGIDNPYQSMKLARAERGSERVRCTGNVMLVVLRFRELCYACVSPSLSIYIYIHMDGRT